MPKYQVFDNGKHADSNGYPQLKFARWANNSKFKTFIAAHNYAQQWLNEYGPHPLKLGVPYDYSGYGDMIEIRKVED